MRKIVAVAICKGGVGKTTTSVNLAASLAVAEKKTLLIDFDPTASCSSYLGFTSDKEFSGIFKILSFNISIPQVITKTELDFLDFIPSDISTPDIEERLLRIANYAYLFKNILNSPELFNYDYIIIDCPPSLKGLTTIALIAANSVLLPVKAGEFSIEALRKMFKYFLWIKRSYNSHLQIEGILRTMYEGDTNAWKLTNEELHKCYGSYLLNTIIPKNSNLIEAEFRRRPAVLCNLKSPGAQAYFRLSQEIMNKSL